MYCKNCGIKLREGAKFCNECGTKVDSVTTNKKENNVSTTTTENKTSGVTVTPINKSKATASLVLGILSFVLGVLFIPLPIVGLILGITQKDKCGEKTAGIILNAIALGLSIISWIFVFIFIMVGITASDMDNEYEDNNHSYYDEVIDDDYNYHRDIFEY